MFLVVVDAHSKWPEAIPMNSTTTVKTLEVLRQLFSSYGLPEQIVTDNGPQFISDEFATFVKCNGIKHTRTAPYHPASNGLAERFVQSMKQSLKTTQCDGNSVNHRLSNYLLTYRTTPHATTGVAPCTLFLNRKIRTRFDLMLPDREKTVVEKQSVQKEHKDRHSHERAWYVGEQVMARNLRPGPDWVPGVIVERLGPVTYLVEVDQRTWKRHADQLKSLEVPLPAPEVETDDPEVIQAEVPDVTDQEPPPEPDTEDEMVIVPGAATADAPPEDTPDVEPPAPPNISTPNVTRRYPSREHRPPDWLHRHT